jgi:hypothetical protein
MIELIAERLHLFMDDMKIIEYETKVKQSALFA